MKTKLKNLKHELQLIEQRIDELKPKTQKEYKNYMRASNLEQRIESDSLSKKKSRILLKINQEKQKMFLKH